MSSKARDEAIARIRQAIADRGLPDDRDKVLELERQGDPEKRRRNVGRVVHVELQADDVAALAEAHAATDAVAASLYKGSGVVPGKRVVVQLRDALHVLGLGAAKATKEAGKDERKKAGE